ncbi:hypothetical protein ACTNDS_16285 [Blautia sp. HCP3S3_C12]|jgi:hypothetical protein
MQIVYIPSESMSVQGKKMKSIKDMGKTGILENREEVTEIGC